MDNNGLFFIKNETLEIRVQQATVTLCALGRITSQMAPNGTYQNAIQTPANGIADQCLMKKTKGKCAYRVNDILLN